jgi:S-adenosyl-L-methionine hydrolase (adenosine-forming)
MRPVVALLTDFGLSDHYVGTMKGVVLGLCPEAALVDLTHDIPPHDITAGSLELAAAFRYFPSGTVFLAVVDPGVGTTRRAIAAEAGGYRFVGPDNGLLAPALDAHRTVSAVELNRPQYAASVLSRTFEGRDRFAPAAGWLASGVTLEELGDRVAGWTRLPLPQPLVTDGRIEGEVCRVDRFGNLVTNLRREDVDRMRAASAALIVEIGASGVLPLVATYAEVLVGDACALVGSTGHVEVSVNGASAARRFGLGRGARVVVRVA